MSTWPVGTNATGSSTHPDNIASQCGGCLRTYVPYNAIDNNVTTFWNDDTLSTYPDNLTIILPPLSPVNLTGLHVVSNADGYIIAYDVYVNASSIWTQVASVTGVNLPDSIIRSWNNASGLVDSSGAIPGVTSLMISVNAAEDTGGGSYSRINEVYPFYAELASNSSSSSTTTMATATTSSPTAAATSPMSKLKAEPHTGAIAGGVVGGVVFLVALIALGIYLCRRTQPKDQNGSPAFVAYNRNAPVTTNRVGETKEKIGPERPQELEGSQRSSAILGAVELPAGR